jgi:hypothetical protein
MRIKAQICPLMEELIIQLYDNDDIYLHGRVYNYKLVQMPYHNFEVSEPIDITEGMPQFFKDNSGREKHD